MASGAKVRRWGNSLGIVLPKQLVEERHIKAGDEIFIHDVIKVADFSDIFGKVKFKESAQELKDEGRKGWKEKRFS